MKKFFNTIILLITLLSLTGCRLADRAFARLSRYTEPDVIAPNTELLVFENIEDWTPLSGNLFIDQINTKSETQSLLLSNENADIAEAYRPIKLKFGSAPRLRVRVFFHDQPTQLAILLSSHEDFSSYFKVILGDPVRALQPGWNAIDIFPPAWENFGGENWDNTMRGFRIQIIPKEGSNPPAVSWDQIIINHRGVAGIMLTFDDGLVSAYTKAFNYMKTVGARGTAYVITNRIGTSPKYLTVEQLQEMDAYDWSIANHSHLHNTRLTNLEQHEIEQQLLDAKESLHSWGLPKAATHVAYPWGAWNTSVINAMKATGMQTGRNTVYPDQMVWTPDGIDFFLGTRMVGHESPLDGIKTWVDEAIIYDRIVVICLHDIVDTVPESMQWGMEDFIGLVDYIHERGLPFLTIDDYYDLSNGRVIAIEDTYRTMKNNVLIVDSPGVLTNDLILNDETLIARLESNLPVDQGSLDFNEEGGFTYTPPVDWTGTVAFSYHSCINDNLCSDPTSVNIVVDAP